MLVGLATALSHARHDIDMAKPAPRPPVFRTMPFGLGHVHAAILRAPLVESRIADTVHTAQINSRKTGLMLLQNTDDLLVAGTERFILCLLLRRTDKPQTERIPGEHVTGHHVPSVLINFAHLQKRKTAPVRPGR